MTRTSEDRGERGAPDSLDTMTRREVLRRAALVLGGSLAAPLAAGILTACEARRVSATAWQPKVLTGDQAALLRAIVDQILPATDTPGASALGVPQFIDALVAESYAPGPRAAFLAGFAEIDARARRQGGERFLSLAPSQQRSLLDHLDRESFTPNGAVAPTESFFRTLKRLTLVGYYTSEIGATRELRYVPVPGRFEGCVPLAQVGRTGVV